MIQLRKEQEEEVAEMKKRYYILIAVLVLAAAMTSGCGGRQLTSQQNETSQREAELEEEINELRQEIEELKSGQNTTGAADENTASGTAQGNGAQNGNQNSGGNGNAGTPELSIEEAQNIALARVDGATAQNISIELDWDDGKCIYEGEIFYNGMEYEFEIDANTGSILKWEQERW